MEIFVLLTDRTGFLKMEEIETIRRFGKQIHRFKIFREGSAMLFNYFFREKTKETKLDLQSGRKMINTCILDGNLFFNR